MTPAMRVTVDEAALGRIASLLALKVRPGDVVALHGDLGAGKTTFARALIRSLLGDQDAEVPSPTFSLCQTYQASRMAIAHFDLYRLSTAEEAEEIGFEEALARGLTLIEWPERLGDLLPEARIDIHLEGAERPDIRRLAITGHGGTAQRIARLNEIAAFLDGLADWKGARAVYLQGDASPRAYARLFVEDGTTAVLMDAPRQPDGPPIREGRSYSQIAHLAEDMRSFSAISAALRTAGVNAPAVLAEDLERGILLVEDMGDRVFGAELQRGAHQDELWRAAVDVLAHLRTVAVPERMPLRDGTSYSLPRRDRAAFEIEIELLLDWYWPAIKGAPPSSAIRAEFTRLWEPVIDRLLALPGGWFIRDYHSPNLLWLPERQGLQRVGVIDFQDALNEHPAFDLVSLLQDARVDVTPTLEAELFRHYCTQAAAADPAFDEAAFRVAYADFGAQRNTRLLGLWVRLLKRDGKPQYLQHLPRTWGYLDRNLQGRHLAQLRAWYEFHFTLPERRADILASG